MTTAILTAAGAMRRWTIKEGPQAGELYGGVPKHLITVRGEPLLGRSVRLLRERGFEVTVVAPPDPRYAELGADRVYVPDHNVPWLSGEARHDADKFLSSRELWSETGRTLILHGDVYLDERAADKIARYAVPEWCLFARYHRHARPFHKLETVALSFYPHEHATLDGVLARLVELATDSDLPRTGTWEVYRGLLGASDRELARIRRIRSHVVTPGHSVEIGPPTTDVDNPAEYEGLLKYLHAEP